MRGVLAMVCVAATAWGGGPSRFELRAWGVAEGLPQTSVTDLCQDSRGFLWVATFGGLARFDGESFLRVDPPHGDLDGHRFVSVACDGARIWAGTDTGRLFHFDDFGRGAPVELELELPLPEPLWDLDVTPDGLRVAAGRSGAWAVRERATRLSEATTRVVAFAPDGATWAAGDRELRCLDGRCAGQRFALEGKVQSLGVRSDGVVLVGSTVGVEALRDGRVTLQTQGVGVFEADVARARTWEVSATGLRVVTAAGVEEVPLAWGSPPLREPAVRELLVDVNGVLWVGTDDQGLLAVRDRGVQLLGEAHGLSHRSVLLVLPLREGGALISTYCHGLERLSADGAHISRVPGIADDECIFAAAQSADGTVWLDRGGRFTRWDEAGPTTLFTLAAEATIKVIEVEGARAWLGTTAGLVELDLSTRPATVVRTWTTADGLLDDKVLALSRGPDGALFIGTQRGAMRLRGARLDRLVPPAKDRPAAVRDLLVEPGGVVWLATYGEGLARVGADGEVRWLTREGGFCSDELSRVLPVGDALWFNTNQGAFRVRRASLEAHARDEGVPSCEPFLSGEGNGGAQRAGGLSNVGLLLPTVNGVARIDPAVPTPSTALPVFIDAAAVDGRPLALEGTTVVPPGRRDLTISLATPQVPRDALIIEQTLSSGGQRHTRRGGRNATWLNLAPGDYVFEARRRGVDGTFGPPTTLRFTLAPTFLETPWARFGLPLLALALIALGVRVWTKTVRERANALEAELEQRRRLEAAQRERDAVYRTVFTGSPVPLFLFDERDVLVELNPAALASFPRAQVGSAELEFIQPAEREAFREVLRRARAGEQDTREFTSLEGNAEVATPPLRRGEERAGVHPAAPLIQDPALLVASDGEGAREGTRTGDTSPIVEFARSRIPEPDPASTEEREDAHTRKGNTDPLLVASKGAAKDGDERQHAREADPLLVALSRARVTEPDLLATEERGEGAHTRKGNTDPLFVASKGEGERSRATEPNLLAAKDPLLVALSRARVTEQDLLATEERGEGAHTRKGDTDPLLVPSNGEGERSRTSEPDLLAGKDADPALRVELSRAPITEPKLLTAKDGAERQHVREDLLVSRARVTEQGGVTPPDLPVSARTDARASHGADQRPTPLVYEREAAPRPSQPTVAQEALAPHRDAGAVAPERDHSAPPSPPAARTPNAPRRRVLRVDAAPLVRGERRSVLVAATDLTAVRDAEAERTTLLARAANAQRLEGLGRLAAGIAHDFNNVLAALSLQIGDLQRTGGDARLTAEMLDAVEMGRNLTRRFLIFGRGDSELKAIDLDDAIGESRAVLGRLFPENVRFEVSPGAPGAAAWLARAHLDQLLLNLVVNARDASRPGGRVEVRTLRTSEPRDEGLQVLPRPAGEVVELVVEDDGAGMDEATLSRAFEPFFTTKGPTQGTGVGLTIVHSIALRAGAGLAVSSKAGAGTRFVLQLRAAPRVEPLRDEAPRPLPDAAVQKPTVLICDDVAPLRSAVGRVFRRAGFLVLQAGDGEEALAQLARHPVSILVTDLLMPKLDGVELITRLRAAGNELPIILLSGFPGDALARLDAPRRRRLVALEKPFVPEVLVKTARELLGP